MKYTKEEEKLRSIQWWQRAMLKIREQNEHPKLPRMQKGEWERCHQDVLKAQYDDALSKGLNTGIFRSRCFGCRQEFYTTAFGRKYCSSTCAEKMLRLKQQKDRWLTRTDTVCMECGAHFTPKRNDAKYCCNACRQKSYRSRTASSQNENLP